MACSADCAAPYWLTAKNWDNDLLRRIDRLSVYEKTSDIEPSRLSGPGVVRADYMCIDGVCDFSEPLEITVSSDTLAAARIAGVCYAVVSAIQSEPQKFCAEQVAGVLVETGGKAFYLENKTEDRDDIRGSHPDRTIVIDAHALYRSIFQQRLEYTRQMETIHRHVLCAAAGGLFGAALSFFSRK